MLYEGEEGLLDVPQLKVQPSFGQVAETSPPQLNHQVTEHATSISMCTKVKSVRSKTYQPKEASNCYFKRQMRKQVVLKQGRELELKHLKHPVHCPLPVVLDLIQRPKMKPYRNWWLEGSPGTRLRRSLVSALL
jgi:hypothetical protein